MMRVKRGFLLSLDAMVAVGLLLFLAVFLSGIGFTSSSPEILYERLYYTGKDVLNIIKHVKIGDMQDFPVVQDYLNRSILTEDDLNKSVLDVIGSFWAAGNTSYARNLSQEVFGTLLNRTKFAYELRMDGESIYKKDAPVNYLARLTTVVSGYAIGKPVSGYVARAYITKVGKEAKSYGYFGGYVGEGNITRIVTLPEYDEIANATLELSAGSNFDLYINGNFSGHFEKTSANMSVDFFNISSQYFENFKEGDNAVNINFTASENNYIGGGYIEVVYSTSELVTEPITEFGQNATKKYFFPGINGLINLYSSFYVPGELKAMAIYLHYASDYETFLTVGNTSVFTSNLTGEQIVDIQNSNLSALLNYSQLSGKTIPVRMGLLNVSYVWVGDMRADVFSVTDVSGSMGWGSGIYGNVTMCGYDCCNNGWCWGGKECIYTGSCVDAECGDCPWWIPYERNHRVWNESRELTRLEIAKEADKVFVDAVLNTSGNRVGLVSYSSAIENTHDLSDNATSLKAEIDRYEAGGWTCICCGINEATEKLLAQSNSSRYRSIVVMSDGEANVECGQQGTGDAKQDAIQAACEAYQNHNITVYSVGFGEQGEVDEATLQAIADCGNGEYYFSNVTELAKIYEKIAEKILNATYAAQTVKVYGDVTMNSSLYTDSWIEFNFTSTAEAPGYGQVTLKYQSKPLRNCTGDAIITDNATGTKEGWWFVPNSTEVIDAKITSYSSEYWTDRLYIKPPGENWSRVYWLPDFGSDYKILGDPYVVQIPVNFVKTGNNSVRIGSGLSPENATGASPDSRVIYTLKIDVPMEGYSGVFPKAQGSSNLVYYDMDGDDAPDGSVLVNIGQNPSDKFDPDNDSVDNAFMRLLDGLNFILDKNENWYGDGILSPYDGINQTNPIDLKIASDVGFDSGSISGIPSMWGPTELEIRTWI